MISSNRNLEVPMLLWDWNASKWINFKLKIGVYQNIFTFFNDNSISFVTSIPLDYSKIPKELYGNGMCKNLLEYVDRNNNDLIVKFLNYFIVSLLQIKNTNGNKLNYNFSESSSWKDSTFEVYDNFTPLKNTEVISEPKIILTQPKPKFKNKPKSRPTVSTITTTEKIVVTTSTTLTPPAFIRNAPIEENEMIFWNWSASKWINCKIRVSVYENILTFLNINNMSYVAEMQIDFSKIPDNLRGSGSSKNLITYLDNNIRNNSLIVKFLNYFIISILQIQYNNGNKINLKISESYNWKNSSIEVLGGFFIPTSESTDIISIVTPLTTLPPVSSLTTTTTTKLKVTTTTTLPQIITTTTTTIKVKPSENLPMMLWNWNSSGWNNFSCTVGVYNNFLDFLAKNNIYYIAEMLIDFNNVPEELRGSGNSKNLIMYLNNNVKNNSLIMSFLNYFIDSLAKIKHASGNKISFNFVDAFWKNATFEVYSGYAPQRVIKESTILVPKFKPAPIAPRIKAPILSIPKSINSTTTTTLITKKEKTQTVVPEVRPIMVPKVVTTITTRIEETTTTTTTLANCKNIRLKFNAFNSRNACFALDSEYCIDTDEFIYASVIYYVGTSCTSFAQNGFYSDGVYCREWNGVTLSEPILCE